MLLSNDGHVCMKQVFMQQIECYRIYYIHFVNEEIAHYNFV